MSGRETIEGSSTHGSGGNQSQAGGHVAGQASEHMEDLWQTTSSFDADPCTVLVAARAGVANWVRSCNHTSTCSGCFNRRLCRIFQRDHRAHWLPRLCNIQRLGAPGTDKPKKPDGLDQTLPFLQFSIVPAIQSVHLHPWRSLWSGYPGNRKASSVLC